MTQEGALLNFPFSCPERGSSLAAVWQYSEFTQKRSSAAQGRLKVTLLHLTMIHQRPKSLLSKQTPT